MLNILETLGIVKKKVNDTSSYDIGQAIDPEKMKAFAEKKREVSDQKQKALLVDFINKKIKASYKDDTSFKICLDETGVKLLRDNLEFFNEHFSKWFTVINRNGENIESITFCPSEDVYNSLNKKPKSIFTPKE